MEWAQLIAIFYLKHQQRPEKVYKRSERLTLSNIAFTLIGISLFTYSLAVQLPLRKRQHGRTGRNKLQPGVKNSQTLNLIVCRKRQLSPGKISLLKRKAQHRRKRIPRKKHGNVKFQRARYTSPGSFLSLRVSRSGRAVWSKCTYLPKSAPLHSELPCGNLALHEDKTAQRNKDMLLHRLPGSTYC